jgi:hypothetical protein
VNCLTYLYNLIFFYYYLDKTLQSNIKDEKQDHYVDNHLKTSVISTDNIDQPLLIVLDEDDVNFEDKNDIINDINSKDDLSNNGEQTTNISNKNSSTGISLF